MNNNTLYKLNISRNFLSDAIAPSVKELLILNSDLKELYLHWNYLKSEGGTQLFEGLLANKTLRVLDLSYNQMGKAKDKNEECTRTIANCLKENEYLMHVDLSNNRFNVEESKRIAEGLKSNQSIYGFHFEGNRGYVDNYGFLVIDDDQQDMNNLGQNAVSHRIDGLSCVYFGKRRTGDNL